MKAKFKVGDFVVLNKSVSAILWIVLDRDGDFLLGIKDASRGALPPSQQKMQWIDVSFVKKPTKKQLLASIAD